MIEVVKSIAAAARKNVLAYAQHPITVNAFWHKTESLSGMCGIASVFLFSLLHESGIHDVKVVKGKFFYDDDHYAGHVWLVLPENRLIIDITASQFNGRSGLSLPDVAIIPMGSSLGQRFVAGKSDPFFIRSLFAFWCSENHPWGRFNGVSHQQWLTNAWGSVTPLAIAA